MNENFIKQTAKDYDMPECEVERIYKLYYPNSFYEELEAFIKNRSKT